MTSLDVCKVNEKFHPIKLKYLPNLQRTAQLLDSADRDRVFRRRRRLRPDLRSGRMSELNGLELEGNERRRRRFMI